MSHFQSDVAHKPDYLQMIGLVNAEWNVLESTIDMGICIYLGFEFPEELDLGRAVTTHLPVKNRMDILRALVDLQLGRQEVNAAFKRFHHEMFNDNETRLSLYTERNNVTHGRTWLFGRGEDGFLVKYTARGKVRSTVTRRPLDELREVAKRIAALSNEMAEVIISHSNQVPKSPLRPPSLRRHR